MSDQSSAIVVERGPGTERVRPFAVITGGVARSSAVMHPAGSVADRAAIRKRVAPAAERSHRNSRPGSDVLSIFVPAADIDVAGSGRTLIVAGDPELRLALSAILSGAGLIVCDADSRETTLRMLNTESFDLVLFDINLPGINRIETCQSIRARSRASIVMLDLNCATSLEGKDPLTRIQAGLCRTLWRSMGERRYRDPAILRFIAALSITA